VVNIVASIITIAFVVGGGSGYWHYLFFASAEVLCMLAIMWMAWRLPKHPESSAMEPAHE
jgi:hypothetical protein